MQTDGGVEQLLARAILDLELKMKHEMRQNSALQLAKIEKHGQQMEKRLGIVEAKLEALLSRDNNSSGGMVSNNQLRQRGSRQQYPGSINRQTNYYSRTTHLLAVNGQGGGEKHAPRISNPVSRTHQQYGMFGNQTAPQTPHRQIAATSIERKQHQRPKQMLGTGANKGQLGEKPSPVLKNEAWTTKLGGIYTSDEDTGDENRSKTHTDSEMGYVVAKPAPRGGEIHSDEEKPSYQYTDEEEEEEVVEIVVEQKEQEEVVEIVQQKEEEKEEEMGEIVGKGEEEEVVEIVVKKKEEEEAEEIVEKKEQNDNKDDGCELVVLAPIQTQTIGGFGRGRRN